MYIQTRYPNCILFAPRALVEINQPIHKQPAYIVLGIDTQLLCCCGPTGRLLLHRVAASTRLMDWQERRV
jgi:hypothetical protein